MAELGLSIDSSGMKPGLADLDTLVQKSAAAETAASKMGQTVSSAFKSAGQSTSDVAQGLKDTADAAGAAAEGVTHAASAHEGLSIQGQAAFHSLRSVVEQMAYGVPPTQALTSHINQLAFAASGPQGLTGAFGEAIGVVGRLVTPAVGVTAAVVGMGAAIVGVAAHWQSAEADIQRSLLGIGGASQATVKSIESISSAISDTGKLSYGEARDAATAIASLGTVNVKLFAPLLDTTQNLSIILGKNVTDSAKMAGEAIGQLGSGSIDGILKINQSLGFLSGTLLDNIQNLIASGKAMDAQKLAIDAIANASKGAQDTLSVWDKGLQNFKGNLSNAVNNAGQIITSVTGIGETLADQYDRAIAKLKELQDQSAKSGSGSGLLQSAIDSEQKTVNELAQKLNDAGIAQFNKQQDQLGLIARQAADSIATEYKQVRDLQTALANINNGPAGTSGDQNEQIVAAQRLVTLRNNLTNANGSIITQEQKQTELYNAQLGVVTAIGASERDAAVATMARAQAIGTSSDAELAANRAVELERASVNAAYQKSLEILQAQGEVAAAVTGSDKLDADTNLTIVQLLQQGLTLEQATSIAAEQRANAEDGIDASIERQVKSLQQQTALIQARQNGTEATVAAAQAYQNAIDAGASSAQASALESATLDNYMARAATSSGKFSSDMGTAAQHISAAAASMSSLDQALANSDNYGTSSSFNAGPIRQDTLNPGSTASNIPGYGSGVGYPLSTEGFQSLVSLDTHDGKSLQQILADVLSLRDKFSRAGSVYGAAADAAAQPVIDDLQSKIAALTQATNDNTSATSQNTQGLDSIYSGGHSALAIGYYAEGQSTYNYDPNGFFQNGTAYTAPTQPYDPNSGGLPVPTSTPNTYNGTIPGYADGGIIAPNTLAYVGEHSSDPKLIRAGAEPIVVTPGVPANGGDAGARQQTINQTFVFNTKANDLGDRRTRRQVMDGFGSSFRAVA